MQIQSSGWFIKLIACVAILAFGGALTAFLFSQRKPPAHATIKERALRVKVKAVRFEEARVDIIGYGEVRARDVSEVSPGIAGRVVEVHPRLEVGELIRAGEVLFKIDPIDYQARVDEFQATVLQLESNVARLKKQYAMDTGRLETFERSRDLAKADFERAFRLYSKDNIESKSLVGAREVSYNTAKDQYALFVQSLELFPLRILEVEGHLGAARAKLDKAEADLERTVVVARADLRVKSVNLERYQYLTPSSVVMTLADDSVLEITVPISSREVRKWLRFDEKKTLDERAWFNELTRVPVEIAWTEAQNEHKWRGLLHRVERFDQQTRTLAVVVRVAGADALSPMAGNLPLVEGMFCRVEIPGRRVEGVVKLPAEAVSFDHEASGYRTVYMAEKDPETGELRLKSKAVKESHIAGEYVYVAQGLEAGELVIITRLINPLENTLLEIEDALPMETD
ncbi:MAG: hypothetical protein IIB38_01370 [Candidatus Hydrogenedentes bacterium]|nr:hypothetical protein [Candidatus Hydrogenedentota bacterium]